MSLGELLKGGYISSSSGMRRRKRTWKVARPKTNGKRTNGKRTKRKRTNGKRTKRKRTKRKRTNKNKR